MVHMYDADSRWKRIVRRTLQIPFGLAAGVGLAGVLTWIFSVEVFMSEVYNGPFKQFLVHLQHKRKLIIGLYSYCFILNSDSNVLWDLHTHLKVVDQF
jgi:hypothetical protein